METQETQKDKKKAAQKVGGLIFAGSIFIGMAAGWWLGDFKTGLFAGMGIGFVLMAVVILSQASKK